jgi:protein-disulfide isomerase
VDAEGLQLLKRIRATNGIALGPITDRSHVLYVFADPNCPHCRASEKTIERLGPDVVAVVMPVAFLPGSDISAASAMCSKDTASAWRQVTAGMPPRDAMNCKAGSDIVTANTKLFDGVGFQYTPTFVSDTGKIAIGEASAQELRDLFH